jgi:hypothetical protein
MAALAERGHGHLLQVSKHLPNDHHCIPPAALVGLVLIVFLLKDNFRQSIAGQAGSHNDDRGDGSHPLRDRSCHEGPPHLWF